MISNLIVLFAGWTTDWKLFAAIGIGLVLLAISQLTRKREDRVPLDWRSSLWLWPWLLGLLVLTLISSFEGGKNDLHFGVDMAVTAASAWPSTTSRCAAGSPTSWSASGSRAAPTSWRIPPPRCDDRSAGTVGAELLDRLLLADRGPVIPGGQVVSGVPAPEAGVPAQPTLRVAAPEPDEFAR